MKKIITIKLVALLICCLATWNANAQSALSFTGTNAYVTFGNQSALGLAQFTVECWFKRTGTGVSTTTGTGGVTAIPLVAKGKSENDGSTVDCNYFMGIRTTGANVLCADFEEGSGGTSPGLNHPVAGTTAIVTNTWYHAAATYDGSTWKLYLNGLLEATLVVNQPVQNLSIQHSSIASALNSTGAAGGFLAGVIDEVRIWNTARTISQIQATANLQYSSPQTNLVAVWGLNAGSGTAVADASGNNLNGTITGAAYSWTSSVAPFNLPFNTNVAPTVTLNTPANGNRCVGSNSANLNVSVADANTTDALTVKFYGRPKKTGPANFSIIGLPDTQFYTEETNGGSNATFKAQTNWIVSKKDSLKIVHVSQLGDCVQNGDNGGNDIEWKRADTSMKIIENPLTTNLTYGLPFTMNVGNHDQSPGGSAAGTTTFFNQYFGTARFSGRPYWGGNYGSNADNSYQLFSANGIDFLVVSLEYDPAANAAVLTWANNLLQTYPTRKAIIVSHWIINADGTFGAQGQAIYNALKANTNLFLMLCGHINPNGENRRSDTFNNNTVHTLLSDYQDINGGNGWLRIMSFNPTLNTLSVKTYSPTLNQYQTDANSEFTISGLTLFNDTTPYTLLSTQSVTGSGMLNYNWTGLSTDSLYEWYTTVADAQFTTTSGINYFGASATPVVNLGADITLQCGQSVVLNAGNPSSIKLWSTGDTTTTLTVNTTGTYSVTVTHATAGCSSADTIVITKLPIVTIAGLNSSYFLLDSSATLTGTPAGGVFSGTGIINGNKFSPTTAGVGGPYTITYSYTENNSCVTSATAQVSVYNLGSTIAYGGNWKYKDDGSNQGTAWRPTSFNDATWASGNGQLGYGDGDETTILNACGTVTQFPSCSNKYITSYLRKQIYIADVNAFTNYQMNMYRDDGVVVYINGNEVYRNNMPTGTINYTTVASAAASDDGLTVQSTTLTTAASFLVNGINTIAVEVHQSAGSSSDLTFDMQFYGIAPPPGGALLTRGPYLQKATPTGITLRWRTDAAVTSRVMYGTDSTNLSQNVTVAGTRTEHTVALTGLLSYTKYYYSVGSTSGIIQSGSQNYFVTNPDSGAEGKYTFWVTGDCGNNSTNQINVRNRYLNYMGDSVTNGWLLLGDNAYTSGTDLEYTTNFFNIYQPNIMKNAPLWPVPGNHDYNNGSSTSQDDHNVPYYNIFDLPTNAEAGGVASNNEAFYSYDYGNIHFIALDSYGEESNLRLYDTTGAQVQWIKQDLAANQSKWKVAYWHHPPYTMGSHNSDTETELANIRANFIRILERYGVDMIMCGHSHLYERSRLMKDNFGGETTFNAATHNVSQSTAKYDNTANSCPYQKDSAHTSGTVYIVSGSAGQVGGTQAAYPHNAMYFSDAINGGSLILQVDGKRLDAKWLCADGVIRDQFTLFKDASQKKNLSINLGASISLTASWKGNYVWSTAATTQTISVSPTTNTTYVVNDVYQCVTDTFIVTVIQPAISAPAITNASLCVGATITLPFTTTGIFNTGNIFTAELSDAFGGFTNPISIGTIAATSSSFITALIPATGLTDGANYLIRIVASTPSITGNVSTPISILNYPVSIITSSDVDNIVCDGDTIILSAVAAMNYQWSNGATTQAINITSSGNYSVIISNANGCSDTSSVTTVVVNPNPVATINASGATTFCAGDSVTLTVANAFASYVWSNGANSQSIVVNTNGQYMVTVIDINGCTDNDIATVIVNANVSYYADADVDGYGNPNDSVINCTSQPVGYVINKTDCEDSNVAINPSAIEICNGLDDNCDGTTDLGCPLSLTVNLLLEGLYIGNGSMIAQLYNTGLSADSTDADSVIIQLYNPLDLTNPVSVASGVLKINGTLQTTLPNTVLYGSFYIAVKHRNSIETWSKIPVTLGATTSFDFSTP